MGTCLTLLDNVEIGKSTRGGIEDESDVQRVIAVGTALVGGRHLPSADACRFDRASFRLSNLNEWVNRSPYDRTVEPRSIRAVRLPPIAAIIPEGEIVLHRTLSSQRGDLVDASFRSHELIELQLAEPVTLEDLEYRFIRPLMQLLSLATARDCRSLELSVGNETEADDPLECWPLESLAVRRRLDDLDQTDPPMIRHHMRFGMNLSTYPPNVDFAKVVARWFEMQRQLASVCDLIFSLYSDDVQGYLQQQLFTVASALEGMHRALNPELEDKTDDDRLRNKAVLAAVKAGANEFHPWLASIIQYAHRKTYVFRIRQLLEYSNHIMSPIVGDEEAWTQELRKVRDGIGHVLPSNDANVEQMLAMLYSGRLLAEIVLMRQLGIADSEVPGALDHYWERENVTEMVEAGYPGWFESPS